jgi:agmatinase
MKKTVPVKPFSESACNAAEARVVLAGAPLDATASFRSGTRMAPSAVREISWHLEDASLLDGRSILDAAFTDAGDLHLTGDLEHQLEEIEAFAASVADRGQKPLLLGGEHLITYPAVRALAAKHENLCVVVFDAHTDLGDAYRDMRLSHASVMKLAYELLGSGRIFMLGTRSGAPEDRSLLGGEIFHDPGGLPDEVLRRLDGRPVYVSVDVDVLDPSVAPGVSTPELLGWSYRMLHDALRALSRVRVVGADVVEICPPYDPSGVTALIGAGLARTLIHLMDES